MRIKVYLKKNIPILKKSATKFDCEVELVRESKNPNYSVFEIRVSENRNSDVDKMIADYQESISVKVQK